MVEDTNFEEDQLASMTTDDIVRASRLLDTEIRILKVLSSSFCYVVVFDFLRGSIMVVVVFPLVLWSFGSSNWF